MGGLQDIINEFLQISDADIVVLIHPKSPFIRSKTIEECVEKVEWLLNHPRERESIAMAGQRRTLGEHTYDKRAGQLDDIINMEFLSGAGSS